MAGDSQEADLLPHYQCCRGDIVDKLLLQPGRDQVVGHGTVTLQQLCALLDDVPVNIREAMVPQLTEAIFPARGDDRWRTENHRKFFRYEVPGIVPSITVCLQVFRNLV